MSSKILKREKFSLLKLGEGLNPKAYVQHTDDGPRCLEQIILAQRDERSQKNCVYGLSKRDAKSVNGIKERYFQIRVKSIEFLGKPATAVYFYDLTSHVKSIQLTGQLLK